MRTRLLLDHEPVADGGYLVRALLRITGDAPDAADRPPLNLSVVLDRSGSMSAMSKLERAKEAASLLVRRLGDGDVVSIVVYDDDVRTVVARAPGSERQQILDRIDAIGTGGMTNLSGGWLRGRELVAEGLVDGGVNRVLLLTDGLANVGITDPAELRDLVGSGAANGISTTTIGFGADYDEVLLRTLAEAGGGSTYYIEKPDQAPAVFEAEIEGLMALAAQNVAVTIAPGPAVEHATVLHRYPQQQTDDGALRLELGDLYALEPRSVLMELLLTSGAGDDAGTDAGTDGGTDAGTADAAATGSDATIDVATITTDGYVLLPGGGIEKRTTRLPIRVSRADGAVANPEVRREALLQEAARAREEALEDRATGAFEDGARKLRGVAEKLAPLADADPAIRDEVDDLRDLAEKFDITEVSLADAKYMYQRAYGSAQSKRALMERLMEDRAADREDRKR